MSLSRKFKKAFSENYNENSGWWFLPGIAAVAVGGMTAHNAVIETPSTLPAAGTTQEVENAELARLHMQLKEVAEVYSIVQKTDKQLQEVDAELKKGKNLSAWQDAKIEATAEKMRADFRLEEKVTDLHYFTMMQTRLPESALVAAVESAKSKWAMPENMLYQSYYDYRDETRREMTDTVGLSKSEVVSMFGNQMGEASKGNGLAAFFSTIGGMVGYGLGFLFAVGGGGSLRQHWRDSLRKEEWEAERARREAARIEREKREADQMAQDAQKQGAASVVVEEPAAAKPVAARRQDTFKL